jgi:hypothetical protein
VQRHGHNAGAVVGKGILEGIGHQLVHDQPDRDRLVAAQIDLRRADVDGNRAHVAQRIAQMPAALGQILVHVDGGMAVPRHQMVVGIGNDVDPCNGGG